MRTIRSMKADNLFFAVQLIELDGMDSGLDLPKLALKNNSFMNY
ncbi:hypothetical protein [Geopsychrobacter electrodiphilus]|nr:hypothetical protein [Geopsychrobacter electrodiphilus]